MSKESRPRHVVIDTCILFSDRELRGRVFATLDAASDTGALLYVPQVVVEELVAQYKRQNGIHEREAEKALRKLRSLGIAAPIQPIDVRKMFELKRTHYRRDLELRLGQVAEVLPTPSASHVDVLLKAVNRRKPFDEKGKGYQDCLIWFSVLDLVARVKEPVLLLTANTSDFCQKPDDGQSIKLHPDLLDDLRRSDLDEHLVSVETDLDGLQDRVIGPAKHALQNARDQFAEDPWNVDEIASRLEDILNARTGPDSVAHLVRDGLTPLEVWVESVRFPNFTAATQPEFAWYDMPTLSPESVAFGGTATAVARIEVTTAPSHLAPGPISTETQTLYAETEVDYDVLIVEKHAWGTELQIQVAESPHWAECPRWKYDGARHS